ncbi:MAG: membrane protein insertion efficiency factor YidD, partial [Acidiphilium sp.]|nr:membrane protein insertion efficiency factor YidD [Acidiphilium sp.]
MNPQTRALRGAVRAYQLIASPVLGGQCRFY